MDLLCFLSVLRGGRGTHLLCLWSQKASQSWGQGVDFGGSGGTWQADFFESSEMCFPFCFYLFSKICLNLQAQIIFLRKTLFHVCISECSPMADTRQARCQKPDFSRLSLTWPDHILPAGFCTLYPLSF